MTGRAWRSTRTANLPSSGAPVRLFGVCVVALTIVGLIAGCSGGKSGSLSDWRTSVCNSTVGGPVPPELNSLSSEICGSLEDREVYVYIGQYVSESAAERDLAAFRVNPSSYATASSGNRVVLFVAFAAGMTGDPARALGPLEGFDFDVRQVPGSPGPVGSTAGRRSGSESSSPSQPPRTMYPPIPPDPPVSPPTPSAKSVSATTRIQWSGSRCIEIRSARRDNRTQEVTDRLCADSGTWKYSEEATTGQLVGGDPIMGDADWIACELYIDGRLEFSDRADAGDGTDVDCLRTVN
jgi:hypothetical protein